MIAVADFGELSGLETQRRIELPDARVVSSLVNRLAVRTGDDHGGLVGRQHLDGPAGLRRDRGSGSGSGSGRQFMPFQDRIFAALQSRLIGFQLHTCRFQRQEMPCVTMLIEPAFRISVVGNAKGLRVVRQ